jgi:hypothetical protein
MSDEAKKRSRAWIWWAVLVVLLAYPLSMGPALRYSDPRGAVWSAYEPLIRLCEVWAPLEALKEWYTRRCWDVGYGRNPKTGILTRCPHPG